MVWTFARVTPSTARHRRGRSSGPAPSCTRVPPHPSEEAVFTAASSDTSLLVNTGVEAVQSTAQEATEVLPPAGAEPGESIGRPGRNHVSTGSWQGGGHHGVTTDDGLGQVSTKRLQKGLEATGEGETNWDDTTIRVSFPATD